MNARGGVDGGRGVNPRVTARAQRDRDDGGGDRDERRDRGDPRPPREPRERELLTHTA
jgi:hypothetical protein